VSPPPSNQLVTAIQGDAREVLRRLPAGIVHCCVTSPPYLGLRDYGLEPVVWGGGADCCHDWAPVSSRRGATARRAGSVCRTCGGWLGSLGLEPSMTLYLSHVVEVFREVWRVMRDDGVVWVNMGDSYCTSAGRQMAGADLLERGDRVSVKAKDLVGQPWLVALALRNDGWWLRSDVVWSKPNPFPEPNTDRPRRAHEYLFLLAKSPTYFYDAEAVRGLAPTLSRRRSADAVDGRGPNLRTVWEIPTERHRDGHFATFPRALVRPCILSSTSERGCCGRCGAPWRRVVEVTYEPLGRPASSDSVGDVRRFHVRTGRVQQRMRKEVRTIGWEPTCRHGGAPVPCTVLDPFAGTGTTLAVAAELGRRGIGIELNPDYHRLMERRWEEERAA